MNTPRTNFSFTREVIRMPLRSYEWFKLRHTKREGILLPGKQSTIDRKMCDNEKIVICSVPKIGTKIAYQLNELIKYKCTKRSKRVQIGKQVRVYPELTHPHLNLHSTHCMDIVFIGSLLVKERQPIYFRAVKCKKLKEPKRAPMYCVFHEKCAWAVIISLIMTYYLVRFVYTFYRCRHTVCVRSHR